MTKFILVSGGVVSGIGKGVIGAMAYVSYSTFAEHKPIPSVHCSFVDGLAVKDNGSEGHGDQD